MTAVATDMRDGRIPRWLIAILFGSLALNLIVIGAAGSLLWRGHLGGTDALSRRVIPSVLGYAVATLPPERVKELEQQTKEDWQKVRPLRRELQEVRAEWANALSAEPFDRARFLTAQSRLVAADRTLRDAALKLYAAVGDNLTPEERRGFASWREQQREGRPQHPLDRPARPAAEPSR